MSDLSELPDRNASYLVVDAADDVKWAGKADEMFCQSLAANKPCAHSETFKVVRPYAGERLPKTHEEIQEYDGIIITGSARSAYDDQPWINEISEFIRNIVSQSKTRLLAVCFGHQLVAHALGGRVEKQDAFVLGSEMIQPVHKLWSDRLGGKPVCLLEAHGDQVVQVPEQCEVLATSEHASVESMAIRTKNDPAQVIVWTLQAHPEMGPELMEEKILPFVAKRTVDDGKKAKEDFAFFVDADAKDIMTAIKTFLLSGWEASPV